MNQKSLADLIDLNDPAIRSIREWVDSSENPCEILPPSNVRDEVLVEIQITTHSALGGIAYETGGILVDQGWLRFLGSGHSTLTRTLPGWNHERSDGFYLVADDAVGGFFAINGGTLGPDVQSIYYWPPDRLEWESLGIRFTDFFRWSLTSRLATYYENVRWPTWKDDIRTLSNDQCFSFFPFLWTAQGSVLHSDRRPIPIAEAFNSKVDIVRQLQS